MERIKKFERTVELPKGFACSVHGGYYEIKKGDESIKKEMRSKIIIIEVKEDHIILRPKKLPGGKKEKAIINANVSHMKNMIQGLDEPFVYKLKACSSHFPMSVSLKGDVFEVSNFIGEKIPRKLKIKEGAKVKIEDKIIIVTSSNKTLAGVVAGEIEKINTKVWI